MRVLIAAALIGGTAFVATPASASCIAVIDDRCHSLPCAAGVYEHVREQTSDKLPPEAFACTA
jgi:hypothetical protein